MATFGGGSSPSTLSSGNGARATGSHAQDLPTRYTCCNCGVCIATSENFVEVRDDALVFSRLYVPTREVQGGKTVACPGCELALGHRGSGAHYLRKDRVTKRLDRLEIMVFSLKEREIADLTPVLQGVFPHSNISPWTLAKAELRGFELKVKPAPDFVVVVHRNEGRVLLTDRNGFYHDVLGAAWQLTRGNVLVVLTRTELKADSDLYDTQLLRSLSTHGDQPTIGAISALGRVLTWETSPSPQQLQQLRLLAAKAYFREPPAPAPPGLPGNWLKVQPQRTSPSPMSWCTLL